MPYTDIEKELIEKLADIEHQRWADWQKYVHSKCTPVEHITDMPHCFCNPKKEVYPNGNMAILHSEHSPMTIPFELVERWERQIKTPYAELSESEKQSDRREVMRYFPLIKSLLSQRDTELLGKLEGMKLDLPKFVAGSKEIYRTARSSAKSYNQALEDVINLITKEK